MSSGAGSVGSIPFAAMNTYGNIGSAALNYGGNPNIGGAGVSYGVGTPNTSYGTQPALPGAVLGASTGPINTVAGPPPGYQTSSPTPSPVNSSQNIDQLWHQMYPNGGDRPIGWNGPSQAPTTNQYGMTQDQINLNTSAYDQAVKDLQGYVPILQNQAQNSQGAINQSVSDITNQANTGEQQAQNTADSATKQQALALQTALGGNNAYAASFGSGLSSFGQGLNNQTYQNYGNTMGGIQNNLQSSLQQFENQKNSAAAWGQNQIAGIQNSLQQGLQQVALNVDQTDMQKANMVAQIQMQAQQQVNQINSIVAQLQANIASAQQNTLASAALYSNTNPQLASNISNLANAFASNANRNVSSVFPGMPGMYGSNTLQNLYGSNVPNQNPYINFNYGSTNGQ